MLLKLKRIEQDIEALTCKKIAVIYGGDSKNPNNYIKPPHNARNSPTYEIVSLEIKKALEEVGFRSVELMHGGVHLQSDLKQYRPDFAWINGVGMGGGDPMSLLPAMMDDLGIPHQFHSPFYAALMDKKNEAKIKMIAHGIKTAPYLLVNHLETFNPEKLRLFNGKRVVIKPILGRASLHVELVESKNTQDVLQTIKKIHGITGLPIIIEQFLPGNEYCIAIAGNIIYKQAQFHALGKPWSFSPVQRLLGNNLLAPSKDKVNYRNDMFKLETDTALIKQLKEIAEKIFSIFNANTLLRLDLRMNETGELN